MKLSSLPGIGNLFPRPKAHPEQREKRPFNTAQIELTSRCTTGCVFCPHQALAESWVQGDMPVELYRQHIAPHLDLFDLVYLQGWGEPMLHPGLWEMLEMARQHGCQTGFTTNGTWLQGDQNERLVETGVDMISVSFAGTAASVHESLRTNSNFEALCRNFEALANLKKQRGRAKPWLELHFLMTRANLNELPGLVELAASLGADEVVATNLAYAPSLELDRMRVFGENPLAEDLEVVVQATQAAARLKMPFRAYPLKTEVATLVCDADPMNSIYVNYQGDVSGCVYMGLTAQDPMPRFYEGVPQPFDRISFGNICDGMEKALEGHARQEFVQAFSRRKAMGNPLAMFSYLAGPQQTEQLPLAPPPCRCCYKLLGI